MKDKAERVFAKPSKNNFIEGDSIEAKMIMSYFYKYSSADLGNGVFEDYDDRADLSAVVFFLTDEAFFWILTPLIRYASHKMPWGTHLIRSILERYKKVDNSLASMQSDVKPIIEDWLLSLLADFHDDEVLNKYLLEELTLLRSKD